MEALDHSLGHYLVELHRPPSGWQALQRLAAQARASAELLNAEGTPVRFLRSIFVPEKDSCFFLYEGASADAVGEAGRRAALAVGRVALAVQVENLAADPCAHAGRTGDAATQRQGFSKKAATRDLDDVAVSKPREER